MARAHPAMSGQDHVLLVDQHRVGESESADAVGDLAHLLLRVGPGVSRPGLEGVGGKVGQRIVRMRGRRMRHKGTFMLWNAFSRDPHMVCRGFVNGRIRAVADPVCRARNRRPCLPAHAHSMRRQFQAISALLRSWSYSRRGRRFRRRCCT
jgi:hypothetical protein